MIGSGKISREDRALLILLQRKKNRKPKLFSVF